MFKLGILCLAVSVFSWDYPQAQVYQNDSDQQGSEYISDDIEIPDPDTMTEEQWNAYWDSLLTSTDNTVSGNEYDAETSSPSDYDNTNEITEIDYYPQYADDLLLDTVRTWLIQGEDLERSKDVIDNYIYYDSVNSDAWYLLGYITNQKENIPMAMEYYRKSIELNSNNPSPYIDIAYIHDVFANPDSMNYYMKQGIDHSSTPESLYYDFGYSFDLMGQGDSALAYYHKWLDMYPNDVMACINIGGILGNRDEIDSAYYYTYKAYLITPDSPDACYNLAMIYKLRGQNQEAIDMYQKALAINSQLVAAKFNLGELYEIMGDSALAKIFYREFVDEAPPTYLENIKQAKAKLGIDK